MKARWYLLLIWLVVSSPFAGIFESFKEVGVATIFLLLLAGVALWIFKLTNRVAKGINGNSDANNGLWSSSSDDFGTNHTCDRDCDSNSSNDSFSGGGGDFGGGGASSD